METIPLWPEAMTAGADFKPYMELYLLPKLPKRGIVLVFPGGGYGGRADHEGRPIAERFNELGFHAAVVHYRVAPNRYPLPQADAFRAIRLVRFHAREWNVKPDKVAVLGFSAGGHLAASTGTLFDDAAISVSAGDRADTESRRPDAMILCYPVLSSTPYGHSGSFENLLGAPLDPVKAAELSLEHRISAATPPAFLWHTSEDQAVPVENSLLFAVELRRFRIPFELHVFPHGPHGIGLAETNNEFVAAGDHQYAGIWPGLAGRWLTAMGW